MFSLFHLEANLTVKKLDKFGHLKVVVLTVLGQSF